jgi:5-methylthioribose kinase
VTSPDAPVDDLRDVAIAALGDAGLLGSGTATLEPLEGGVSNDVVVVRTAESAFVVKRALPRLRVAELWEASAERSFTEASALRWAHSVAPDAVPEVVAVDRAHNVLVIELAPHRYRNWKQQLLAGDIQPAVGARLGDLLARWHVASTLAPDVRAEFDEQEAFAQLRVTPFYLVAADRNPEARAVILGLAEQLARTRATLVHGDFSPKNILVDPDAAADLWVIDWEVAHAGDPVFDVAFLLHHLVCKMIARPQSREPLAATAEEFLRAYLAGTAGAMPPLDQRYLLAHTGALVLARVDGKSPVDYFSADQREQARRLALAVLRDTPADLTELWRLTDDH